ncbi:MAG: hypothetical protein ACYS74_14435 [Planctomycetota bacterium]
MRQALFFGSFRAFEYGTDRFFNTSGNFLDLISQTFLNGSSRPALTSSSSENDFFGIEDGAVLTTHFVDGLAGALHPALDGAALTEADAALDKANNERFNMLVKELQKDSQFIVITNDERRRRVGRHHDADPRREQEDQRPVSRIRARTRTRRRGVKPRLVIRPTGCPVYPPGWTSSLNVKQRESVDIA